MERFISVGSIWSSLEENVFKPQFRLGEHLHILNCLLHTMNQEGDFYSLDIYPKLESLITIFAEDAGYIRSFNDAKSIYEKEATAATEILLNDKRLPHFARKSIIIYYLDKIYYQHTWNKQQAFSFCEDMKRTIYEDNNARYEKED